MKTLFNDGWSFSELAIDEKTMYKGDNIVLFVPDQFYDRAGTLGYEPVRIPHDWQIYHVKDLYKNSVGFYKKSFELSPEQIEGRHNAIRFEGIYMNSAVWVNGKKAGEWKYGYATFEYDISNLVKTGCNEILVIAVYQNCNTRWYSGAGIFRDVTFINTPEVHLTTDGLYFTARPVDASKLNGKWNASISVEAAGKIDGHKIENTISTPEGTVFAKSKSLLAPIPLDDEEIEWMHKNVSGLVDDSISRAGEELEAENPRLWDTDSPFFYILTSRLYDKDGNVIDEQSVHCGFKYAEFTSDRGFFLNGRHIKIYGACHHHDHGILGSAFDVNALRRQFNRLKEMGINSIRCSHNPPPSAWMDLCDEMGLMVDDESFDMWEKNKTPFDYANYFNEWCERDVAAWVRRDRNHPSLIMWSIGNEINDTHEGNGFEITKRLYSFVVKNDPNRNAPITSASNYMMGEGAQKCATQLDVVGYNYLERLYDDHHAKHPEWKIYGSETSSTVQSRGIYHFPESLKLVTFSDGQCSTLGNCTTSWGGKSTQKMITGDRDCPFSAGQFIWTGWDYIGEPTPYHSKNSFFGQIDTAGFPKDTFYLYKAEWAGKRTEPFVHLLPYWDWNEGQKIDVKAYSNADSVELFFNGKSLGCQKINHKDGEEPFGRWNLEYHRGEVKAVAYDENGSEIAQETKRSFGDPERIVLTPENENTGDLHFIQIMTVDKDGTPVENARNYITVKVDGDAELLGMDNGDSTDYDEYKPTGQTHTRKLFANRLIVMVRTKIQDSSFVITAASKDLQNVSLRYDGSAAGENKWSETKADTNVHAEKDFVPTRKIELTADGETKLDAENREVRVSARVLPENASLKEINWNAVLKECVSSDNVSVAVEDGDRNSGKQTAVIHAESDGECILRCTARNGTENDEVLSDLAFAVSGIGTHMHNPYKLIEACRMSSWDESDGKAKPEVSLESGICTLTSGRTWISFDNVDFGSEGADLIHIPIFAFSEEVDLEVWDGKPVPDSDGKKGELLGKFIYRHKSIYNVYSENTFTLNKKLFGVHTLSFVLREGIYFRGFYFDRG
ncbi:MAG: DUF4982 domain-containing protein [Treponema sp.]|nr:DUF4982 domain-containing protein [Treponema sp.]